MGDGWSPDMKKKHQRPATSCKTRGGLRAWSHWHPKRQKMTASPWKRRKASPYSITEI